MIILKCLFIFWFIFNIPIGVLGITVSCFTNAEVDKDSIFLYPLLIDTLREELNKVGTTIVVALFSIFFMPAIIIYFILFYHVIASVTSYVIANRNGVAI
jgi:hypothetical protein